MIELLSIGDRLTAGEYRIHSSFATAVNFEQANAFVSVVDKRIGPGPFNIVISGAPLETIRSLRLGDRFLYLNGEKKAFDGCPYYNSQIDLIGLINLKRFFANLMAFEKCLIDESSSNSLAFLFRTDSETDFRKIFERELRKRIRLGVRTICLGNIINGVKIIKGLGFGLTPSGDDFIAGMMYALRLHRLFIGRDCSRLISRIYDTAIGGNSLSNAYLYCAKEGCLSIRQKMLVKAILYTDINEVRRRTEDMLTVGETSGADWATGLLMTLKNSYGLL